MPTKKSKDVLKATNNAELLSYIINANPVLSAEIDLPVQGQDLKPIGQLIIDNQRYKNAFINTINLIGLTVIKRNRWRSDWDFTMRGSLSFGQSVREIINDLCNVYQYNDFVNDTTRFLENVVPNVFQYIHDLNLQIFYQQTTSDAQLSMAFQSEDGLFNFIDESIAMLWESLEYDLWIVDKYQLCRRILDGTVPSHEITNYNTITPRERVSQLKSVSNLMTFRNPNFNPAGIRRATSFDDQIFILNTEFEAQMSTEVLATSYFRDEADMRARAKLIDSFSKHDVARLQQVLGNQYVAFTADELIQLENVVAVVVSREWFMDYQYNISLNGVRETEFYNPVTLKNNHFLHYWGIMSSSPFENCCVFTAGITPSIASVTVSPSSLEIYNTVNQTVQLSATVVTTGFANKAVTWSIEAQTSGTPLNSTIDVNGKLSYVAGDPSIVVTATSVYDNTKSGSVTIDVSP
ncbi:MAG: hypothetical protein NC548_33560 [Lachnospiraceae bacterium]|nr:hypothetical protein [Lachnospiraceae bacterium]MCM1232734.1 hypothetical protein [Ruminococcus flavefaciens]